MSVLLAEEVVKAAERKLETAKHNLADTDAQSKAQLVSTNDVTRAQIQLATADREVANDQGRLRAAYINLGFVINAQPPTAVAPRVKLLQGGEGKQADEETLIKQSLSTRPDLVARREAAIAAHESAKEPRYHYLPSLNLTAQVNATSSSGSSGNAIDGQAALSASWLIYDGGARRADIQQRDAQAQIADLNTLTLVRSIEADVRSALNDLTAAQAELVSAHAAQDAAKRGADEAAILYRQGLAKAIELLDANDQRFAADVSFATAEFDVANAYLELRQALGFDPLETP